MPKISAVIMTLNEELHIRKCLASLKDIADEILVVDSYSTDSTEKICSEYGVRFIKHEFEGYVEQRSFATSLATWPHVLSVDGDEELSDELRKSILEIKGSFKYDGYVFSRLNNYCGKWIKHSDWYHDTHLRLFDSRKGKWAGISPHDVFKLSEGCRTAKLKGDLYHWYHSSIDEHINNINNFSTISAKGYFAAGKKAGPCTALFHMMWTFFRSYFLKAGFLDGNTGFILCTITAWAGFLKYSKLRILNSLAGKPGSSK